MLDFYETADYGFSAEHRESLERFYRLAFQEGHIPEMPAIETVDFRSEPGGGIGFGIGEWGWAAGRSPGPVNAADKESFGERPSRGPAFLLLP